MGEHGTRWERKEAFDCSYHCRRTGRAELDPGTRALMNCTLPGYSPTKWRSYKKLDVHMGRPPDYAREGQGRGSAWMEPPEDIEHEGCPGGWYRSRFIGSVQRYIRRRASIDSARDSNPFLDRTEDPLVIEAVMYFEREQNAADAHYMKKRAR